MNKFNPHMGYVLTEKITEQLLKTATEKIVIDSFKDVNSTQINLSF